MQKNDCGWCGITFETSDPLRDQFCSERCKQQSRGNTGSGGFGADEAAGLAILVMFLMTATVWVFNQIRRLAPHVGRESSIAMRLAQIKKLKSIDLHRELVLVGEAVFANRGEEPFVGKYEQQLEDVDSIQQELDSLVVPEESKVIGGVKNAAQKKLLERKRKLALACLGEQAFNDFGTKINPHIPTIQPVVSRLKSLRKKIDGYEEEVSNLRGSS